MRKKARSRVGPRLGRGEQDAGAAAELAEIGA